MINNKVIKDLNPCEDRFDNYLKFYENKSHTPAQFMGLKNITHKDKLWVVFRLMTKDSVRLAVADIAESVLHIFEARFPNDLRPRKAIEAARSGNASAAAHASAAASAAASDASAATYATYAAYAAAAAYASAASAAASAAAYAAYAAAYAAYAAASAAAASDASAATYAADVKNHEKVIRKICLKYLK